MRGLAVLDGVRDVEVFTLSGLRAWMQPTGKLPPHPPTPSMITSRHSRPRARSDIVTAQIASSKGLPVVSRMWHFGGDRVAGGQSTKQWARNETMGL